MMTIRSAGMRVAFRKRGRVLMAAIGLVAAAGLQAQTPDDTVDRAMNIFGDGDVIQAMQILQPVAEQGHPRAQVRLAYIYDQARMYDQAMRWYREAAEAGNSEAAIGMAQLHAAGEGTDADPQKAGEWMSRAAENGERRAVLAMADAYEHGKLGLEADSEAALSWYRRAADMGSRQARQRLARAYTEGELGLTPDPEAAQQWADSPVPAE